MVRSRFVLILLALFVAVSAVAADVPLRNWSAPASWTPPAGSPHGLTPVANANETTPNPMPFFPITPCRVADTRGNGFTGAYGTPALVASASRNFTITGQCGIPTTASAVSFNFTVANTLSSGDLRVWPAGGTAPTVSTLNWLSSTVVIANSAIVPLSGSGAISVQNDATTTIDLIIDVNGYYYNSANGTAPMATNGTFAIVTNKGGDTALFASNANLTIANTFGAKIWTSSSGANSTGVLGQAFASTGVTYGLQGTTGSSSADAAGVLGTAGTVWAQSTNCGGCVNGVRGASSAGAYAIGVDGEGTNAGVLGQLVNTSGTQITWGALGYSATDGVYTANHLTAVGGKSFVEPTPTDPTTVVKYVDLEGNEAGTYFRGRGRFVNGMATVDIPEDFRIVSSPDNLSIQVTPIGRIASVAVTGIDLDHATLIGDKDVEFFFQVNGVRRAMPDWKPMQKVGNGDNFYFLPRSPASRVESVTNLKELQQRLIASGLYNADGSVNMDTAERLGLAQKWREAAAANKQ